MNETSTPVWYPQLPSNAATRGRINRMFKYFRNRKNVRVRYEYNDSLGGHKVRSGTIEYDRFEINGIHDFQVVFYHGDTIVWVQELTIWWEFIGLGRLSYCNSGPYCHFSITT